MKCPECGINHRKIEKIEMCKRHLDNEYAHYVIICSGLPGGVCEENIKKSGISFLYYKEMVVRREKMKIYLELKKIKC